MKPTECEGVLFFEDFPSEFMRGEEISTQLGGVFRSAQLASLRDLKIQMARECKTRGCNAVIGFTYGQKSVGFLKSFISRDDVTWRGGGYLSRVPDSYITC
ncbi:hypothetical protein JZU46_04830 [bacterium]|jgi:hypothetical protein|nr:hypothetical protein [bacterium]